jgi:glycosyltransferase involved in cell wall biosynthesis
MNDLRLISIVTITFNNYEELLNTVESVRDLERCEHIIINGGDCPKTLKFLQTYSGKSVSEPDQGISDAFNKGIKYSKGDTVMMLNSGDILLDQSYPEQAMKILNENPEVDFVHADELYDDVLIGKFVMQPLRFQNNLKPNIGRGMPYRHQTMVVRKTVYDRVGWFDLSYISSDYDWVCRWEVSLFNSDRGAYYLKGNPVVKMDGAGVSATQESKVMWEAIQIIKINFPNKIEVYLTFLKRLILFSGRKLLKWLGQENYLSTLKLRKYNNKWSDK